MPNLTVVFTNDLNESVQKGDTMYYVNTADVTLANGETEKFSNDIIEIGEITSINYVSKTIIANILNSTPLPTSASFFVEVAESGYGSCPRHTCRDNL